MIGSAKIHASPRSWDVWSARLCLAAFPICF
jgi:hypothetical protein